MLKDIGLVLCGGGGKGAFQIGAWKALEEHGILEHVGAIAGTSVGGLNAVLFALGDYENAQRIWSKVTPGNMLKPSEEVLRFLKNLARAWANGNHSEDLFNFIAGPDGALKIKRLFSRKELVNLIKENLKVENVKKSEADVFVTIQHGIFDMEINYVPLKTLEDEDEIINALLATSSIPVIYGAEEFKEHHYRDGGLTEFGNVPIKPLYDQGYRKIVIVSLNSEFDMEVVKVSKKETVNLYQLYPDCEFLVIKPLESLGGIDAMLDFRQKSIQDKIKRGYLDSANILEHEKWQKGSDEETPILDYKYLSSGVPSSASLDSVAIYIDGKSPKTAALNLTSYISSLGINTYIIDSKDSIPNFPGKVIVVGHHDFSKGEIKKLDLKYHSYGMKYGFNDNLCIVQARRSELRSVLGGPGRDEFKKFYDKTMLDHRELAQMYDVPMTFEHGKIGTREYQYDLLWLEFVKYGLEEFLGIAG